MVKRNDQEVDMRMRHKLAKEIAREIKDRKLRHIDVSQMTGVMRAHVGSIIAGRLERFSVSRLLGVLDRLGATVDILVEPSAAAKAAVIAGETYVSAETALTALLEQTPQGVLISTAIADLTSAGYCSSEIQRAIRRNLEGGAGKLVDGVLTPQSSENTSDTILAAIAA